MAPSTTAGRESARRLTRTSALGGDTRRSQHQEQDAQQRRSVWASRRQEARRGAAHGSEASIAPCGVGVACREARPEVTRSGRRRRGGSRSPGRRGPRRPPRCRRRRPRACPSRGWRPDGHPHPRRSTKPTWTAPDRGRVVVEQADRRVHGLEVRDELLAPLAPKPAVHVDVARVEVAADADGPAIMEACVPAGAGPAHQEPALAVPQHEVRDDLLVGRVLPPRRRGA